MSNGRIALLFLVVIILTTFLALNDIPLPDSVPATADSTLFSAERAFNHLRVIAAEPRFIGSPAHQRAREYLLRQLRDLGYDPIVDEATVAGGSQVAIIHNVIVTIPGSQNSKAILLASHYDTVPLAPGANDDGSGVVGILETLRALKYLPPLKNDLIVLFTDGEELGMLGAKAFMMESPLAHEVGFALNFEARGSSGPSIMFETNNENGWVVREFDSMVPEKFASSMFYDLYRLLPNNTDFTHFKKRGASGLNFAYANNAIDYHTVNDNLLHCDIRSLQHHGNHMLAGVLHFGNIDLTNARSPNVAYFSFLFGSVIIYPISLTIPIVCAITLLFGTVMILGRRRRVLSLPRIGIGFLIIALRITIAAACGFLLWRWLGPLHPEFGMFYLHTMYQAAYYLAAFLSFSIVVAFLYQCSLTKKVGEMNLAVGAGVLWLLLGWGLALVAPAATYIVLLPLFFMLAGLLVLLLGNEVDLNRGRNIAVLVLTMIPGIYLGAQLLYLLYHMMTLFIAAALAGLLVLFLGSIQIQVSLLARYKSWLLPVAGTVTGVVCILLALLARSPDESRPKPNSLMYAADADSLTARWITWDDALDEWTGKYIEGVEEKTPVPQFLPFTGTKLLSGPARYYEVPSPGARMIREERGDSVRVLKLELRPTTTAAKLLVDTEHPERVHRVAVNGIPVDTSLQPFRWPIQCAGMAGANLELEVILGRTEEFSLRLINVSDGFPQGALEEYPRRLSWMIPRPAWITDVTLVARSYRF